MIVQFVQQGSAASRIMQQAFEESKVGHEDCVWVTEEECLGVKPNDRKSVYIFEQFSGDAFSHIVETKNRIYGPMCLVECGETDTALPKVDHPVSSLAMLGVIVSCTSLEKSIRGRIHQLIQWMSGEIHRDFSDQVTHLVAGEVGTKKYVVAANLHKKVMSPEWVEKLWEASQQRVVRANNPEFEKYKCPVFAGLVITVSGLESSERQIVRDTIDEEGGRYSGEMKIKECTHLIINKPKGQKYEFAKKWKIHIVKSQWLFDSVDAGYCMEEHKYRVSPSDGDDDQDDRTSTPTKRKVNMSALSDISAISVSNIDETAMNFTRVSAINNTRMSTDSTPSSDPLDELDVTMVKTDMFLDGCKIFLSGFRGQKLEKLRRLINLGGGTRFNQINESVSHVIIGDKIEDHLKQLRDSSHRPHVVNVNWLLECVKQGMQVAEEPYLSDELPPPDPATPVLLKQKPSLKRQSVAPKVPQAEQSERKDHKPQEEENDMQELMSQYLPQNNTDMTDESALLRAVEAGEAGEAEMQHDQEQQEKPSLPQQQQQQPPEDDDATQDPTNETVTGADLEEESQLFAGKVFVICGFESHDETQLAGFIKEVGGEVVKPNKRSVPDYAVVPIFGCPVSITVGDIVTNAWLQICLESEVVYPVDSNELFTPVTIDHDKQPLEGCVLSVSGYTGTERDCLMLIAEEIGAVCQEYFLRKPQRGLCGSTHLVVNAAEGSKYVACKKWNLPAVSKYWLFECAKKGRRLPEGDFLVDNPNKGIPTKSPVNKKVAESLNNSRKSLSRLSISESDEKPLPGRRATLQQPELEETAMETAQNDVTLTENNHDTTKDSVMDVDNQNEAENLNEEQEKDMDSSLDRSDKENQMTEIVPVKHKKADEEIYFRPTNPQVQKTEEALSVITKNSPMQKVVESVASKNRSSPLHNTTEAETRKSSNTPVVTRPTSRSDEVTPVLRNNRVKELIKQNPQLTPRDQDNCGVDTPGKFLDTDQQFLPKFDLGAAMEALQSPVVVGGNHQRRSSMPLDDAFGLHISKAIENSMGNNQPGTPNVRLRNPKMAKQAEVCGPLKGVVIAVSKKLSSKQSEYNNIAAKLGADYRWTYDPSCTHFIFQGRANDLAKEFRTARDQGKTIVSPYWLTVCKEQNARVDESLFPHTYNPKQVLSLSISSKSQTPSRSLRRGTRATKVKKDDVPPPSPESHPQPKTRHRRKQSESDMEVTENRHTTSEEDKSDDLDKTQSDEEMAKACADAEADRDHPPASMAIVDDLKNLMAATTRTYSKGRRRSRRNDSIDAMKLEDSVEGQRSRPSSRLSDKSSKLDENDSRNSSGKEKKSSRSNNRSRNARQPPDSCVEPSQMVEVTWDDPGAREQQEILAVELAKNSESFSPKGVQSFSSDDENHPQMELRRSPVMSLKRPEPPPQVEMRVPTPEPPSIAFPIPTNSSTKESPQPVELIDDDAEEEHQDTLSENKKNPVFLLSGLAQQEREHYGALVEQLGGQVRDATFYDSSCTHLVVGQPTRNEKYLACVATGKWVLHKSYFEACRQENSFVEEDGHEWGGDASAALLSSLAPQVAKLARAAHNWRLKLSHMREENPGCCGAFDGWRVMIMSEKKREDGFRRLLVAGGAEVLPGRPPFTNLEEVTHAFMDTSKLKLQVDFEAFVAAGVHCVKPEYIASYLMENPVPDPQQFYIPEVHQLVPNFDLSLAKKRKTSGSATPQSKRTKRH